ncbi:hypothetical protein L210DRAFT_3652657 [Boletus edulis BED1]|uniref:NACHT domain-containing protein n=1 Tax=Boletus edulis BED1 TaxID=1328754 RepID=A0AAD4BGL3_BOLED|nr:hypothetical protein L210DRAFT_3652657 [Boletus edulis BED1]
MDSVKSVLRSIVSATQHVQNAIAQYSTARGLRKTQQYSFVRLESEFQSISDTSRAILEVLDNPLLRRHYLLDDRLVDWLSDSEPETCLDTLKRMEGLLNIDHDDVQVFSGFTPTTRRTGHGEDGINLAITLFYTRKAHFHFLLTTDIWNYEREVFKQTMPSKTEDKRVQVQEQSQSTSTKDSTTEHQRKEVVYTYRNPLVYQASHQRYLYPAGQLNKLLGILRGLDCSRKHRETSSIRQSDTCTWLPATDAYKSWREGKDTFLWLQGKAGAGKTVLASSVINDLDHTKKDGELLVYFYCDFRTARSTSCVEVMCSLLAQLTEQLCPIVMDPEAFLDELLKGADSRVDTFYSVDGLARYLSRVAELCPRKPLVVVDALDECREVETLLDGLIACNGDVRLFVTSRPLHNIVQRLSHLDLPCISMDKMAHELSADILLHVTRVLDSRGRLRTFDGELKEEIRSKLCAKANGMFRWVQCQIDTLDKCTSVSEIRRALKSLPEGLEETYRRILIAVDKRLEDGVLVRRALMWLVTALRPMRLRELLEGVTIDPIRRVLDPGFILIKGLDFLEVSRSLVVHNKETDIVALSHMSVKEYLVGDLVQAKLPRYHIILEDAHEHLARLSMAYISFCLEEMMECRDRSSNTTREQDLMLTTSYASRPLLKYVLSYGFSHLSHLEFGNAGILEDMETLQVVICRRTWEWDHLRKLVPSTPSAIPWPGSEHDFMIYNLVAFASDALFDTYLGRSTLTPREGTNPLVYAAHFGKYDHAKALILRDANVNHWGLAVDEMGADDSDEDDMDDVDGLDEDDVDSDTLIADCSDARKVMPIQAAVDHWHAEMLDLLLAHGSIIPDRLLTRVLSVQPHRFPLYIIRRLLQTAEFITWAATPWDNRRLLEAVFDDEDSYEQINGGDELELVTTRLVQAGCAEALLLVAVEKGCIPVIRTLLSMNTPSPSDTPSTSNPHAIVDALADNGDTPLHIAMRLSNENQCLIITKLLVEAGCNPCGLDADDKPPIYAAVARGFVSVVEYLLSRDVPLPPRILFAAFQTILGRRVEVIRLLVSKGDVHVRNPDGDTLLHTNVQSLDRPVCLEIAEILIDAGCNPSAHNLRGETPLHIAAKQGYHEIVNYLMLFSSYSISSLLEGDFMKQTVTLRSLIGNTDGFHLSSEWEAKLIQGVRQFLYNQDKCLEWAKVFVGVAGDIFARSSGSSTLLDLAVSRGFGEVVEYLISQAVQLPSAILFTALRYQVWMIPLLIRNGADVQVRDENKDTLLHVAMSKLGGDECLKITQTLAEAGCDTHVRDAMGRTPLSLAEAKGHLEVAEYLRSVSPSPLGSIQCAILSFLSSLSAL